MRRTPSDLRRVWLVDVLVCPHCRGARRLLAAIRLGRQRRRPWARASVGDEENDGWQVSVSTGQVFAFGGATNTLSVR